MGLLTENKSWLGAEMSTFKLFLTVTVRRSKIGLKLAHQKQNLPEIEQDFGDEVWLCHGCVCREGILHDLHVHPLRFG